jgi:hypothetical protein
MVKGLTLYLSGKHSATAAAAVKNRLAAVGRRAEIFDERLAERIGSAASRTLACEVLIRNGVAVLITTDMVDPPVLGGSVHAFDTDTSASHAVEQAVAVVLNTGDGSVLPASRVPEMCVSL